MNIHRVEAGLERVRNRKIWILIPIMYVCVMSYLIIGIKALFKKMGEPYSGRIFESVLYVLFMELIIVGICEIIQSLGKPIVSKKIERELANIGFVDNEGHPPLLLYKGKNNKGFSYEFYSAKIPFNSYECHKAEIETALNKKVVEILSGKDKRHTIIKVVKEDSEKKKVILWKDEYLSCKDFELVLGESYFGIESIDISATPHVLLAGETGSGKSKLLQLLLVESLMKGASIYLADFKGGVDYPAIWHKSCKIITEPEKLNITLENVLIILEERRKLLIKYGVPNIGECNKKYGTHIPRIIVACDEIAEVLDKTGLEKNEKVVVNQIEAKLSTIARLGRAFGIHLFLATQRPDAEILKGQIKNNIGYRICGRSDKVLSQMILDSSEAADKISHDDQGMFLTNMGVLFKAYYVDLENLEGW